MSSQVCTLLEIQVYGRFHRRDRLGSDACTFPVLSPQEAAELASSGAAPLVHPKLSRTLPMATSSIDIEFLRPGENTKEILDELGVTPEERARLEQEGILSISKGPSSKL